MNTKPESNDEPGFLNHKIKIRTACLFCIAGLLVLLVLMEASAVDLSQEILIKHKPYRALPNAPISYDIIELERNAKDLDFWVIEGIEPDRVYYQGHTLCEDCSFYEEEQFLGGNRIYLYKTSGNFILYYVNYEDLEEIYYNSHKQIIAIRTNTNISPQLAEEQLIEVLVRTGIVTPDDTIAFSFEKSVEEHLVTNDTQPGINEINSDVKSSNIHFITSIGILLVVLKILDRKKGSS